MNYNDFNQETQLFLNKAMNIYSIVEHRHIEKMIFNFIEYQNYKFTEFDKKILSLFIAGILADGNLKEIFAQYDNIKLEDLYDFLDIKKSETDKILLNESYQEFYEENFKIDLKIIIDSKPEKIKINYITPEVIILSLKHIDFHGYKILNYLGNAYEIDEATIPFLGFSEHPIFKHLEDYTRKDGSIKDETIPKKNEFIKKNISPLILPKKESLTKNDNNIWNLLEEIKKKFIGQEKAIEELFYNIVNNQQLAKMKDIPNSQRAIIFMDGEIGTGKTAITREIIEKIKITNVITSITDCSPNDDGMKFLTNLLKELYRKAENDIIKAQKGIIVFDNFDNIAYSGLRFYHQQLSEFISGKKYNINVGNNLDIQVIFDTSQLTFICLSKLNNEKRQVAVDANNLNQNEQNTTPQDLINIGLEKELASVFNTYLHTDKYSKELLQKIFKKSPISPLVGFEKWINSQGKTLIIDEEFYALVAEQAYKLNTGARSLQTVLNNIRTPLIKEVFRGTSNTIHLGMKNMIGNNKQKINRKGKL